MQVVTKKNFLILLAGLLVIGLGIMAISLIPRRVQTKRALTEKEREIQQIQTQSNSDDIESIEEDLNNTDLIDVDKELQDIENEIEATY